MKFIGRFKVKRIANNCINNIQLFIICNPCETRDDDSNRDKLPVLRANRKMERNLRGKVQICSKNMLQIVIKLINQSSLLLVD